MRLVAAVSAAAAAAKPRVNRRMRIPSRESALEALPLSVDEDQRESAPGRPILRGTRRRSRGRLNGTRACPNSSYTPRLLRSVFLDAAEPLRRDDLTGERDALAAGRETRLCAGEPPSA